MSCFIPEVSNLRHRPFIAQHPPGLEKRVHMAGPDAPNSKDESRLASTQTRQRRAASSTDVEVLTYTIPSFLLAFSF